MIGDYNTTEPDVRFDHFREILDLSLESMDAEQITQAYRDEQRFLEFVKSGDYEAVKKMAEEGSIASFPSLHGIARPRIEEYITVAAIQLLSRCVIEAGVSIEESLQLSDLFIKRLLECRDTREVLEVRSDAYFTYTKLVRIHHDQGKGGIYVEQCKHYITSNVYKKIRVSEIATYLNLNPIYLERVFKKAEGCTIGNYIQQVKIKKAKSLLKYSNQSLAEISDILGFSSQSYFGQIFKKATGMTPREYQLSSKQSGSVESD